MAIEIIAEKLNDNPEKFVYRIISQTPTATLTGMTATAVTFAEVEVDADLFAHENSKKYVIEPIATLQDWNHATVNFCIRCGHKLDGAPYDNTELDISCDNCDIVFDVHVHHHATLPEQDKHSHEHPTSEI